MEVDTSDNVRMVPYRGDVVQIVYLETIDSDVTEFVELSDRVAQY